jgi:branched-chain amino acid transport system ATP-binding protein
MLLEVTDLHVHYGRLAALRGISLSVDEGEIVCVVGPNGAGKSTTLLAISGALTPTSGSITVENRAIGGMSPEAIARMGISQVPEGRHIFTTLSVEENLRIGTYMRSDRSGIDKDFRQVMELFPILAERRNQSAGKLSGGEQQMLAIGRALLTKPRIMTIDEPSLGLAPALVNRVYAVLLELREKENLTLLIVEQSSERALKTADRIYVLRDGQVQIEGKAADLQDGVKIHQAYFGFTEADGQSGKVEF